LSFLGGAPAQQIAPFQAGNVAAQQQIARGLPQIQAAFLGLPTDLSGFQARQIGQPSDVNINIPQAPQQQPTGAPSFGQLPQGDDVQQRLIALLGGGGGGVSFGASGLQNLRSSK